MFGRLWAQVSKGLILALDVEPGKARSLIRDFKDTVDIIKIGSRLFTSLGPSVVEWAHECGCKVFLDLKFHDIPVTVAESCRNAARMKVWGLTIHASGGFAMMKEAVKTVQEESKVLKITRPLLFGVTVLTSLSQTDLKLIGVADSPIPQVVKLGKLAEKSGLDGVVASGREIGALRKFAGEDFLIAVPGIRFRETGSSGDQKRVMTPERASKLGADYLIVGRPILEAKNPGSVIERIRKALR